MKTNYLKKLVLSLFGAAAMLSATAQPTGWTYKMPILVKENSGNKVLITNYELW